MPSLPFFPPAASSVSTEMDLLYAFIALVCAFFTVVVVALVVFFTVKYKRKNPDEVGDDIHGSLALELTWTFIPFVLAMVMFWWGASLFYRLSRPPSDSMDMTVIGKQWMWKIQHPEGIREINELHVPKDRNVRLTIGSEDVIHDFSLPAFRVKMDAVPGKLTTLWFKATRVGAYHIFCMQYCGTKHSGMVGTVYVMEQQDYDAWLAGGRSLGTPVQNGERLFVDMQCITCHKENSTGRGPSLVDVAGGPVHLSGGRTIVADDNYLRESIVNSQAKVVDGFQPIMPTFQGQVSEENLLQLIAYLRSISKYTK